jgi:hypothetical protein
VLWLNRHWLEASTKVSLSIGNLGHMSLFNLPGDERDVESGEKVSLTRVTSGHIWLCIDVTEKVTSHNRR